MLKILQIGVTLARQPTPLQNDMIQSLLTYRNKYQLYSGKVNMQFEAVFTQELELVIAPRKADKYTIGQNHLMHIQQTQLSLFVEQNRRDVKEFTEKNAKPEEKVEEEPKFVEKKVED